MTNAERQKAYRQRREQGPVYLPYHHCHADLANFSPSSKTQKKFIQRVLAVCMLYRELLSPEEMAEALEFIETMALDLDVEAWRRKDEYKHLYDRGFWGNKPP
jgi:hypothetical protein